MKITAPARHTLQNTTDLTLIIVAAGAGKRIGSLGNRSLIHVGNSNLVNFQIQQTRLAFPNLWDVIVVTGFDADRVVKTLPRDVRIVECENYSINNTARSIGMGLMASRSNNVIIAHGDVYFGAAIFKSFSVRSCLALDYEGRLDDQKVGAFVEDGRVVNMAYGITPRWGGVVYLTGKPLEHMRQVTTNRENRMLCTFEILNSVVDAGETLWLATIPLEAPLVEFSSIKTIQSFARTT